MMYLKAHRIPSETAAFLDCSGTFPWLPLGWSGTLSLPAKSEGHPDVCSKSRFSGLSPASPQSPSLQKITRQKRPTVRAEEWL